MGKLIYSLNVSLDGFIETPDHSLDWAIVDDEVHHWFNEQSRTLDASLYGRRMYELMAAYWPTAEDDPAATEVMHEFARIWKPMPKIVFSRSLDRVDHNARLVQGDVGDVLEALRTEFEGDLDVSGADLAGQFVRRGLVDEYQLMIHPVVLGAGTPFWPMLDGPLRLRLTATRRFASGVTLLSYAGRPRARDSAQEPTQYRSTVPRDPNIPDAFDVYTLVLLRRPPDAPAMSEDELDALQARHLAYRAKLRSDGILVVNGPLSEQSDPSLRGLSIFACGLDEARRLSDLDPSVQAGRLTYDVFEWWVAAGTLAFPGFAGAVGERRAMPDD